MDHIRTALRKAGLSLDQSVAREHRETPTTFGPGTVAAEVVAPPWTPRRLSLSARHLERRHIVSFGERDPRQAAAHGAFDLLRTRIRKTLRDNGWKTLGITSPTPGCGKTMISVNLAFSMARTPDCRTVLIDLDLRKPAVASTLGISAGASVGQFLEGKVPAEDCFSQVSDNLFLGLNDHPLRNSSEYIQSDRIGELISWVFRTMAADFVFFDLPPMGSSDDALAFLPEVDGALMVVAAGTSTDSEVRDCERQLTELGKPPGIILNKSREKTKHYYHY